MIRLLLISMLAVLITGCQSKQTTNIQEANEELGDTAQYDSLLAKKLGADDYGMSMYVMAFLKKGPNRPDDPKKAAELQTAHMSNIKRLAEEGKLVLAGPFGGDGDLRGIYVFDVATVEEAKELTETDPAIKAGSLVMDLVPWYGSAGVKQINEIHTQIAKVKM